MKYKQILILSCVSLIIFIGCRAIKPSPFTVNSSPASEFLNNSIIYKSSTQDIFAINPITGNNRILTEEEILQIRKDTSPNGLRIICCKQLAFGPYEDETTITTINTLPWDETVFEPYTAQWSADGDIMIIGVQVIGDASDQLGRFALYAMDRETLKFSTIGEGLINTFDISKIDDRVVIAKVQDAEGQDTEEAGVYVVDLADYTFERILEAPYVYDIVSLKFSPNGNWLAIAHSGGVDLFDLTELTLQTLSSQVSLHSLEWSPDSQWLAGIGLFDDSNVSSGTAILNIASKRLITVDSALREFVWSPDSRQIAFIRPVEVNKNTDSLSIITLSNKEVKELLQAPRSITILDWR